MAGWFNNGICYAEQQQAIDAHFQAIQPTITNNPTNTVKTQFIKQSDGSWDLTNTTFDSTGNVTLNWSISAGQPIQLSCEIPNDPTTNFLNGMELGWAVAGVMVIVFCIRRTYRGF